MLWRVRSDGTEPERVREPADYYAVDVNPDPSPDGPRVVYSTNRTDATMPVIRVLDVLAGDIDSIDVAGVTPRWSTDGEQVAYVTTKPSWGYLDDNRAMRSPGFLALMRPDETQQRIIPTGTKLYLPVIDWSPDGAYLIARSNDGLIHVVDVWSGETMPLSFTRQLELPAWKP